MEEAQYQEVAKKVGAHSRGTGTNQAHDTTKAAGMEHR